MSLPCNVGTADRVVRGLVGVVSVGAALAGLLVGAAAALAGVLGGVLVATAILGFCPLYRRLGLSSCRPASPRP